MALAFPAKLLLLLGVVILVWVSSVFQLLHPLETLLYDLCVRQPLVTFQSRFGLLLITSPTQQAYAGDDYWISTMETIQALQPKKLVFTFLPTHVSEHFYARATDYGNVIFGRAVLEDAEEPGRLRLETLPMPAKNVTLSVGVVAIPSAENGIYRHDRTSIMVGDRQWPTLASLAARPSENPLPEDTFLVNFLSGRQALPEVAMIRVLKRNLISELVTDKVVLVGLTPTGRQSGLHTPLTPHHHGMSLLHFQAFSIATLLSHGWITPLEPLPLLLLLLTLATMSLFFYQRLTLRQGTLTTVLCLALYVVLGCALLGYAQLWVPLFAIGLSQLLTFVLLSYWQGIAERASARESLKETLLLLKGNQFVPASLHNSDRHWSQLGEMVNQVLPLQRLVFFEREANTHRVREVIALHCSIKDIDERRRDYHRFPYSASLTKGQLWELDKPFLRPAEKEEIQYIAPLVFLGNVLGFWVFAISSQHRNAIPHFLEVVNRFSQQIAEILYRRQRWAQERKGTRWSWRRSLGMEGRSSLHASLQQGVSVLGKRLQMLQHTFDGLPTATILYDLFGGIIQINRNMEEVLKDAGFTVHQWTALDFVRHTTSAAPEAARDLLRYVVLQQQHIVVNTTLRSARQRVYILIGHPVRSALREESDATVEVRPFGLFGIVFSLVDVTEVHQIYHLKQDIIDQSAIQLRNRLASLSLASDLFQQSGLPSHQKIRLTQIIQQEVDKILLLLSETQRAIDLNLDMKTVERYPVNARKPLVAAIGALQERAEERRINFVTEWPHFDRLVVAGPQLKEVFSILLDILLDDAVEESELRIKMAESESWITYLLSNTGYGIPNEYFQALLKGDTAGLDARYQRLRTALQWVELWHGDWEGSSEVGIGMWFVLRLKVLI